MFLPQFSDNYYRAELIDALTNSLTPAISINNEVRTVDNLNADVRLILEEITRFLNMEKLLPSYRNTITVRCCRFIAFYSNTRPIRSVESQSFTATQSLLGTEEILPLKGVQSPSGTVES